MLIEEQNEFKRARSTVDSILTMKLIMKKRREQNLETCCIYRFNKSVQQDR